MTTRYAYLPDSITGEIVQVLKLVDYTAGDEPLHMQLAPAGKIPKTRNIFKNGNFVPYVPPPISNEQAVAQIEEAVETRRQELSSPLAAKRDHYNLKAKLAQAALTDTAALTKLEGEASARGVTAEQLRDLINATAINWQLADQALAALEAAGKAAVSTAVESDIETVLDGYLNQIKNIGA